MLFNFSLVPLGAIQPWGEPGNLSLSWFGLTDGQYWIQAGSATLFEYSDQAHQRLGAPRYCEYQVSRLYEDVMEMVPYVLEPVPAGLVSYISGERGSAWTSRASRWYEANAERDDDRCWQIVDGSGSWLGKRSLDSAYLSPSAGIRMWSDESNVHIEWDNRDKLVQGVHAWSALCGSHSLPRGEFVHEVRSFHVRLMEEMAERVKRVMAGALPVDVRVDLRGLRREHEERSLFSEAMFVGPAVPTDWQVVRDALSEIERDT